MANDLIKKLIGQDLSSFKIIVMNEVSRVDEDGINPVSLGFFKNPDVGKAFAGQQSDSNSVKVTEVLVLSDGKNGFTMDQSRTALHFDDEKEILKIKENAIKKLSPEEQKILGLV